MDAQRLLSPWDMECPSRGSTCPSYERSLIDYLKKSQSGWYWIEDHGVDLCPKCLKECYRYTRENRQGEWPEFKLVLDCSHLWFHGTADWLVLLYNIASARERSASLEQALFCDANLFEELGHYMASDIVADHRDEAEAHLLGCAMQSAAAMKNAVRYSTEFKAGGWHDALETAILEGRCGLIPAVEFAVSTKSGRWPPLETILLGSRPTKEVCQALIRYAAVCVGTRWDPAEQYILAIPHQPRRRNAIVSYARDVAKGRWEEAEDELVMSPRHLYGYAKEVMKGRLPEGLHEKMVMHGFLNDRFGKMYVQRYAQKP